MKNTILLTGFEPFNNERINPSWEAVRALEGWTEHNFAVHARQLPCKFGLATEAMCQAINELQPQVVIAVGQAGGRAEISVERVAINIDDAPIPDNAGYQPIDKPICASGSAAYFATLPVKAVTRALREAGLPAAVSQNAGTFVCNHLFYGLMRQVSEHNCAIRAGFIHVPYIPQQVVNKPVGCASMSIDNIIEALRIAVRTTLAHNADVSEVGGSTH